MSKHIAVIGAGPAGLFAAETLAKAGASVTIYDRMPSPARKFLMAGRGGLNLTHSEPLDAFVERYGAARAQLEPSLRAFPPTALRDWAHDLGVETFVGSSGRIFPTGMKASPLLRAWLRRLDSLGVRLATRHAWRGWDAAGALRFATGTEELRVAHDATILALGGASWPRLGSDGHWAGTLRARGVAVTDFAPSNVGFEIAWSDLFRSKFAGAPLKPATFYFEGRAVRGEAVITDYGLEGGAIYQLSAPLRDAIARDGSAILRIDLRPGEVLSSLDAKLSRPRGSKSDSSFLRGTIGLAPVGVGLLREAGLSITAAAIKSLPLKLVGARPLERAISTAGGVAWDAVTNDFELRAVPRVFVAGEMLDWEAPTGGYLLQACFSTARAAAEGALAVTA
ncbi:TIGR03862 family flavoprotein [Roseiterribacter gracilis]|uniref:NAD(FAD)-utilizing dehydrogenase n=1 Tax=Roseiterribacter gracilis TaxID=2812848 RepID=A0A8S8XA85_9PROT|nr:NAD(FAD)-utilizing dehydrogenase [Rhodospirillales bacterium TMPK1]